MLFRLATTSVVIAGCVFSWGNAFAQSSYTQRQLNNLQRRNSASQYSAAAYQNRAVSTSVPRFLDSNVSLNTYAGRPTSKPFSSYTPSASNVTPYLSLSASPFGGVQDYYNLVRPQLQQQQQQQARQRLTQQQRQQAKEEYYAAQRHHQLTQMAASNPFDTTGSEDFAPTGHGFTRMDLLGMVQNLGSYFPPSSNSR